MLQLTPKISSIWRKWTPGWYILFKYFFLKPWNKTSIMHQFISDSQYLSITISINKQVTWHNSNYYIQSYTANCRLANCGVWQLVQRQNKIFSPGPLGSLENNKLAILNSDLLFKCQNQLLKANLMRFNNICLLLKSFLLVHHHQFYFTKW